MTPQKIRIVSALIRTAEEVTFTLPLPDAKEGSSNEIFARPANLYALLSEKEPHFDSVTLPERKRFRCPRLRCLAADYFQMFLLLVAPRKSFSSSEKAFISFPHRTAKRRRTSFPAGFCHLSAIKISLRDILVLLRSADTSTGSLKKLSRVTGFLG